MKVQRKNINELFVNAVQYEIPMYQRRYVWDEKNWEPLWTDIINNFANGSSSHFTGAVVSRGISESERNTGIIKRYEIIDGQQRLTTFQIILCAFKDIVESEGYDDELELLADVEEHIKNAPGNVNADQRTIRDDYDREGNPVPRSVYKLLPTVYDSDAFRNLVKLESSETREKFEEELEHSIYSAYIYFRNRIQTYVDGNYQHMVGLYKSFIQNFEVAIIDLDSKDQSQEIFLSINATGRQLSEFDYLRNYIFLQTTEKEERDNLYKNNWRKFEEDPWTTEKLDRFFHVFLMAKLGSKVFNNNTKLFDLYQKDYYEEKLPQHNRNSKYELDQLELYAETYKELDDPHSEIGSRIQLHRDLSTYEKQDIHSSATEFQNNRNIVCVQSLILHLRNEVKRPVQELYTVCEILESYVARRLLYDPVGNNYTYETIEIFLNELVKGNREFTVDDLVEFLTRKGRRRWRSDDDVKRQFKRSFQRAESAGTRFRDSLRFAENYIFYRIENLKREQESKKPLDYEDFFSTFALPDPLRMPNTSGLSREVWGNLANSTLYKNNLVKPRMRSFADVKNFLRESDNNCLLLNQEICSYSDWNDQQIVEREEDLLDCFNTIWKSAEKFTKKSKKPVRTKSPSGPTTLKWISRIESDVYQPIRFDINHKNENERVRILTQIKVIQQSQVEGIDKNKRKNTLYKSDILFISSEKDWAELLYYSTVSTAVSISKSAIPHQIDDTILKFAQQNEFVVKVLTRSGREFVGKIKAFDGDAIYLQIERYEVIVFRSGLFKFVIVGLNGVVKRWGPVDLFGYIEFSEGLEFGEGGLGLPEEIYVKNTSLDPQIIPQKLQPDMKVKCDLEIVQEQNGHSYFQASNVNLVTIGKSYQGEVKLFSPEKGSGFLTSKDYHNDIYLHKSQLVNSKDINLLRSGYQIEFDIAETIEGRSAAATNVRVKRTKS